jgi:hypothetical protein
MWDLRSVRPMSSGKAYDQQRRAPAPNPKEVYHLRRAVGRDATKPKRRAWPRGASGFTVVAAVMALAASACGAGSTSPGVASGRSTNPPASSSASPGSSNPSSSDSSSQSTLAFSNCMRAQGVPNFPDEVAVGKFPPPQDLGVSNAVYQAAMNTCKHSLPNGGQPTQVASPQLANEVLGFAQCVRAHGIPGWPDPTPTPSGPVPYTFNLMGVHGFDPRSPQVDAALNECQRITGLGVTGPPPFGLQRPAS